MKNFLVLTFLSIFVLLLVLPMASAFHAAPAGMQLTNITMFPLNHTFKELPSGQVMLVRTGYNQTNGTAVRISIDNPNTMQFAFGRGCRATDLNMTNVVYVVTKQGPADSLPKGTILYFDPSYGWRIAERGAPFGDAYYITRPIQLVLALPNGTVTNYTTITGRFSPLNKFSLSMDDRNMLRYSGFWAVNWTDVSRVPFPTPSVDYYDRAARSYVRAYSSYTSPGGSQLVTANYRYAKIEYAYDTRVTGGC